MAVRSNQRYLAEWLALSFQDKGADARMKISDISRRVLQPTFFGKILYPFADTSLAAVHYGFHPRNLFYNLMQSLNPSSFNFQASNDDD